ncbi:Dinitrogenase iron-molybdenum cofactor [Natranaerofaba carboxydovora]|nr:Dinitrogenase iron-molybdenum cofactor [Natranaerofaba carboxydovora]
MAEQGVECVISGGMGERARQLFASKGIDTLVGIEGEVEAVINDYMDGKLSGNCSYCEHDGPNCGH